MYNTRRYFLCAILIVKLIYKIRVYQYIVDDYGDDGDLQKRAQINFVFYFYIYTKKKIEENM